MKKFFFLAMSVVALNSWAADPRIRTEVYDKSVVYDVHTQIGRASLIQFEDDESLVVSPASVLGIGDAEAWNLGVRGNNIVLKPTQKMPQTNIVVVTNKRTYSFELLASSKQSKPTYVLRFRYPDSEAAKIAADAKRAQLVARLGEGSGPINTNYVWRGNNALLKPTAAFDDGRFTRLIYDHAGELPVFYKVLPDGTEALINTNVEADSRETVVLQEVVRTVRARLGSEVIEIINKGYALPRLNRSGTSVPGTVRIEKGQQ